jgi:predicted PurR-regulated permease PerM
MAEQPAGNNDESVFIRRVLIAIALIGGALILWQLRYVLVLLFGTVLVATIIRAIANPVTKHLRLPEGISVALSVLVIAGVVGGTIWLVNAQISAQAQHLADAIPKAVTMVDNWLAGFGLNHPLESWFRRVHSGSGVIVSNFAGWLSSLTFGITSILILVFGGIFLAAQPRFYGIGAIKLVPAEKRSLIAEAMLESENALRLWLKGQIIAMVVIGVLTWVGFIIIGLQSALVLAVIAGVLEFIPYAGPIASAVPAVLVALVQSPELAIWTVVMYVIVHHVEAYVLQPLVQQYAVDVPAVVMLFSLLAFGMLFGLIGVLFAAPMAVVAYVMVKRLYVVEALQTPTPIPGEKKG